MTTLGEVQIPPPDAAGAVDELNCPLCGYDLRGLPEFRCPECGHAFDPEELRRAKREKRAWLFEHAPTRLRAAWLKTSLATLWPGTFWKRLVASHAIVLARLNVFAISWLALAVGFTVGAIVVGATLVRMGIVVDWAVPNGTYGWITATDPRVSWLDVFFDQIRRHYGPTSLLPILALCMWPLTLNFGIRLFGTTLKRANIDHGHLSRLVSYSLPPVLLVPMLTAIAIELNVFDSVVGKVGIAVTAPFPPIVRMFLNAIGVSPCEAVALFIAFLWSGWSVTGAHICYLRVPQALMQAVLVHVVAWLSIVAILATVSGAVRW